jgi:hypothetical protein
MGVGYPKIAVPQLQCKCGRGGRRRHGQGNLRARRWDIGERIALQRWESEGSGAGHEPENEAAEKEQEGGHADDVFGEVIEPAEGEIEELRDHEEEVAQDMTGTGAR